MQQQLRRHVTQGALRRQSGDVRLLPLVVHVRGQAEIAHLPKVHGKAGHGTVSAEQSRALGGLPSQASHVLGLLYDTRAGLSPWRLCLT